jgi:hypothetical protein
MFNPLVDRLQDIPTSELDSKISSLQKKYFQTQNPQLRQQIAVVLEMHIEEARARQAKQYEKINNQSNNDLDNLINIS